MRLRHENSEIRDGFEKGYDWLKEYVKPIDEEIEKTLQKS